MQNRSARSRRTLRLSVRRVRPPVPGSTASSGSSGSDTAERRSSISVIQSHASRQLVAAAGRGAADRGEVALAGIFRGVLDRQARLVGELAEIDLVAVRRLGERADIGAGAEHIVLARADDDRAHLGVLEAQALHRVGQLDIDAEIVGIELQFGAGIEPAGRIDIEGQGRDRAVDRQPPMAVARRVGAEIDRCHWRAAMRRVSRRKPGPRPAMGPGFRRGA